MEVVKSLIESAAAEEDGVFPWHRPYWLPRLCLKWINGRFDFLFIQRKGPDGRAFGIERLNKLLEGYPILEGDTVESKRVLFFETFLIHGIVRDHEVYVNDHVVGPDSHCIPFDCELFIDIVQDQNSPSKLRVTHDVRMTNPMTASPLISCVRQADRRWRWEKIQISLPENSGGVYDISTMYAGTSATIELRGKAARVDLNGFPSYDNVASNNTSTGTCGAMTVVVPNSAGDDEEVVIAPTTKTRAYIARSNADGAVERFTNCTFEMVTHGNREFARGGPVYIGARPEEDTEYLGHRDQYHNSRLKRRVSSKPIPGCTLKVGKVLETADTEGGQKVYFYTK